MQISFSLKDTPGLQLRRAAAVGLHSSIESWFQLRKNSESAAHRRRDNLLNSEFTTVTPMSYITNLGNILQDTAIVAGGMDDDPANQLVLEVLQWATEYIQNESDVACKSLYLDMLRIAVDGMS